MSRRVRAVRYAIDCADCGHHLLPGERARFYRKRGVKGWIAYGVDCHERGHGNAGSMAPKSAPQEESYCEDARCGKPCGQEPMGCMNYPNC